MGVESKFVKDKITKYITQEAMESFAFPDKIMKLKMNDEHFMSNSIKKNNS